MKRVVLIGTSHTFQRPQSSGAGEFLSFIRHTCDAFNIQAIGEEMSIEGLQKHDETQSICERYAAIKKIPHRYCDPDNSQRKLLSVKDGGDIKRDGFYGSWSRKKIEREIRKSYTIREQFWFDRLIELNTRPLVFVRGANHVRPFSSLLRSNGFKVHTAAQDWEPSKAVTDPKPKARRHRAARRIPE